jgi:hypothetical protein
VAGGNIIMIDGIVTGTGGTMVTTEAGRKTLEDRGVPTECADLAKSLFYNAPDSN